jgi:phosphoribosylaminoimidazolecarboxamide formyltransferase/IMP cyclohydrolase
MELNRVAEVDGLVPLRKAIVSTANKSGLIEFIQALMEICPELVIYSTGGTYTSLQTHLSPGIIRKNLHSISEYTGQPEMQGGLVKTLDYRIYLGLLSETYNEAHRADLVRMQASPFDLVVVNLYPFQEAISKPNCTIEDGRTHIDIGGPTLLRAGAKNFLRVATLCDPSDYPGFLEAVRNTGGCTSLSQRFGLARKVFRHTAEYDEAIARFLETSDPESFDEIYTIY